MKCPYCHHDALELSRERMACPTPEGEIYYCTGCENYISDEELLLVTINDSFGEPCNPDSDYIDDDSGQFCA